MSSSRPLAGAGDSTLGARGATARGGAGCSTLGATGATGATIFAGSGCGGGWTSRTSGGLLIAVDAAKADVLLGKLAARQVSGWQIGTVEAAHEQVGSIHVGS